MTETRWGILGAGWISSQFSKDLLIDPKTRGINDINHKIVAVGSRSLEKAKEFVEKISKESGCDLSHVETHGTYEELYNDKNVDVIYVGSPHSHHYAHVHAALQAGKHVLCEKSMTVNGQQAQALADLAREKGLFLQEAVWTRFQPYAYKLQEVLRSGTIGDVRAVEAALCSDFTKTAAKEPDHRLVNPNLAGGSLLDLGPYPWTQLSLVLRPETRASHDRLPPPKIVTSMTKTQSGVDASTVSIIEFPQSDGRVVQGIMTAAQDRDAPGRPVLYVEGTVGFIEVTGPTYRPASFRYEAWDSPENFAAREKSPSKKDQFSFEDRPGSIWGFAWEADEVARCLRDGKTESDRMPLNETILMMESFDEMRRQGQFVYPEALETLDVSQAPA